MLYSSVRSHQIWGRGHARHADIQVAGNKSDEDTRREVTWAEGSALARKLSAKSRRTVPFVETSAKLKTNVALAFAGTAPLDPCPSSLTTVSRVYVRVRVHVC